MSTERDSLGMDLADTRAELQHMSGQLHAEHLRADGLAAGALSAWAGCFTEPDPDLCGTPSGVAFTSAGPLQ